MTARGDLELVIGLACETADRDTAEQRALLRVAMRLELDLNRSTTANLAARHRQPACRIVDLVESSYEPTEGRPAMLAPKDRAKLEKKRAQFAEDMACADRFGGRRAS